MRQAVGGGLLSVKNAIETGACRSGDSGWAWAGALEGGGGSLPPFRCIPAFLVFLSFPWGQGGGQIHKGLHPGYGLVAPKGRGGVGPWPAPADAPTHFPQGKQRKLSEVLAIRG